jgi:UDPglucose--hexose-1-phosphate uridylyltransferase
MLHPHRRRNPLTGEWVLVSPQRTQRPWQGKQEPLPPSSAPRHDPSCYLCPGNTRAGGARNPDYPSTYVFTNDFPALLPEAGEATPEQAYLLTGEQVTGTSRVVCFSPRHDLTFADLPVEGIRTVIDTWAQETATLGERYRWVQVFENKGALMGCSNAHPHGQIWAGSFLPNEPAKEDREQRAYLARTGSVLLLDYVRLETERGERIVAMNDRWAALVPFWAVWPFELLILPRTLIRRMPDASNEDRDALAALLSTVLRAYDKVFSVSFPYTMGWHGAPFMADDNAHWQLHAHVYPPLLRSASVKKFMVGYEMLAEPQRDVTAESAAAMLRSLCSPSTAPSQG